jgi:hypothetical protein
MPNVHLKQLKRKFLLLFGEFSWMGREVNGSVVKPGRRWEDGYKLEAEASVELTHSLVVLKKPQKASDSEEDSTQSSTLTNTNGTIAHRTSSLFCRQSFAFTIIMFPFPSSAVQDSSTQ